MACGGVPDTLRTPAAILAATVERVFSIDFGVEFRSGCLPGAWRRPARPRL